MSLRIYGNRLLKTLPGLDTRPTTGKVREAVFNIWQGTIAGCRWLDLCVGSGAMGAEALCRGAARVVGIEQFPKACAIAQENWQRVAQPEQRFQILRGDVVKRLPSLAGQQFDRIYFDPPYDSNLYEPVLRAIVAYGLLAPQGEIAAEHRPGSLLVPIPGLVCCREKTYGNTAVTFFQGDRSETAIEISEALVH
ncbi:16S rRNA (guanine(966)-N(2))-methyltransferase RsmD [Alkalinema sp. FACHB-956]|uniref:16S rRNA (guanine(966)-N(2))-methyltransferase RsmD n=1 Tax=Alkalinema sp. FACHB-956 TaxID=2692768 RepID=UPI001F548CB6|nr:16S rRNA (guanine(966)-N(2))-methyltransferase RsmD [Alkalinema sp. FACHB-956]